MNWSGFFIDLLPIIYTFAASMVIVSYLRKTERQIDVLTKELRKLRDFKSVPGVPPHEC